MVSLVDEAEQLDRAARGHMRAARRERRRAKELQAQLARVIALAARQGIEITVNEHRQAQQGEPSGNRNTQPPQNGG